MIKNHAKAEIEDVKGKNPVLFEVNYDKKHKDYIRITIAGVTSVIKRDDLWNFVFVLVETDKQEKMVPVRKQEMEQYVKQHTVELQKDMKKGDIMAVNCMVNVRKEVADAVRRDLEKEQAGLSPDSHDHPSPFQDGIV